MAVIRDVSLVLAGITILAISASMLVCMLRALWLASRLFEVIQPLLQRAKERLGESPASH